MKILKIIGILIVVLVLSLFGCGISMSKKMPAVIEGKSGDALASKMLEVLNKPAWDTLNYLQWEFKGMHKFKWDKRANIAIISWSDNEVVLDLNAVDGIAKKEGAIVTGQEAEELKQKAWSYWCNDSFWMFAPFKVFDTGVSREVVATDEAAHGLKVTYETGGVTPGDTYLWLLDQNYMPIAYRMYVSIIPVQGIYTSWESWIDILGAKLSTNHKLGPVNLDMKDVKGGQTLASIDAVESDFSVK